MPRIPRKTIHHIERTADALGIPFEDAWNLRRCALALHRWYEGECGDSNEHASWCIVRDEATGKPYLETHRNSGGESRRAIRDLERGAERRIVAICSRLGLHFYLQTDPRGGTLYLSRQPISESSYTSATFLS